MDLNEVLLVSNRIQQMIIHFQWINRWRECCCMKIHLVKNKLIDNRKIKIKFNEIMSKQMCIHLNSVPKSTLIECQRKNIRHNWVWQLFPISKVFTFSLYSHSITVCQCGLILNVQTKPLSHFLSLLTMKKEMSHRVIHFITSDFGEKYQLKFDAHTR